jgi:alpha-1,2-glucosyltransferase
VHGVPPLSDEHHHYVQIAFFLDGSSKVISPLTTLPTYHALLAGLGWLFGASSLHAMRTFSLLFSALLLAVVWRIAGRSAPGEAEMRSLQVLFLPILYPLLFLVYTDVLSLLCVCAAVLLTLRREYLVAGLVATAAVAVRQTNVIWLAMLWGMAALDLWIGVDTPSCRSARSAVQRTWTFALGAIAFVAFVVWNGGVALGDRAMHPSFGLHLENVFFMLLLFFLLFLPLCLARSREAYALLRHPPVALAALLGGVLFFTTFQADHPYNGARYASFLHNRILLGLSATPLARLLFLAASLVAALTVAVTPLSRRSFYLLYPATLASLLPVWHVEPRYDLVPFTLFILFRRRLAAGIEGASLAWFVALSAYLLYGTVRGRFFL